MGIARMKRGPGIHRNRPSGTSTGLPWRRLLGVSVAGAAIIAFLELLPSLQAAVASSYRIWLPSTVRAWIPLALAIAAGSILQFRPPIVQPSAWERAEALAARSLGKPLSIVLTVVSVIWLVCWVPHYLTWPWWADMDHFSMMAHAWDVGIRPYRDVIDYSFPGPVYWMWGLGKAFGWGHTLPAFAVDSALVIGLGFTLAAWSGARFAGVGPGLAAYVGVLSIYLSLNYAMVVQRDWYATLFALLSLFALEARHGRRGRILSAGLLAASLAFRPYAVLFIPACLAAIAEDAEDRWALARGVLEWSAAVILMTILAFSPLMIAGIFDDFVRSLRWVQPGGEYSRNSPEEFLSRLRAGVFEWRYASILIALGLIAGFGPSTVARTARTWALALAGVAFYKPLSPIAHDYMDLPRMLLEAVSLAPVIAWVLGFTRLTALTRLFVIVWLLGGILTNIPLYCAPLRSLEALPLIVRGQMPTASPPGAADMLKDLPRPACWYPWDEYSAALEYLRGATGPNTRVANVLRNHPFPTFNGPLGRLTPFRSVGGLQWLRWVGPAREPEFAQALETAGPDAVVIWAPDEMTRDARLAIPDVIATIRRSYRPEAKFGIIEVWRRAPSDGVSSRQ